MPGPTDTDADSAIGDDSSLTSSLATEYDLESCPYTNGRRYHAYKRSAYFMPNDDREQERLNIIHDCVKLVLDQKLYLAPVFLRNGARILDIGTGTGIWAEEMGIARDDCTVIGSDLSPIQPTWGPRNVMWELDDVEDNWTYGQAFDFIHSRFMAGSIKNWRRLLSQCFQNLKSGGWVEFQELDLRYYSQDNTLPLPSNNGVYRLHQLLMQAYTKLGRPTLVSHDLVGWATETGFTNVHHKTFQVPLGPWPLEPKLKLIGRLHLLGLLEGLEALTLKPFAKGLDWSPEEIQIFLMGVRQDAIDRHVHMMCDLHVVFVQKS